MSEIFAKHLKNMCNVRSIFATSRSNTWNISKTVKTLATYV
jgi:hypothetical protein